MKEWDGIPCDAALTIGGVKHTPSCKCIRWFPYGLPPDRQNEYCDCGAIIHKTEVKSYFTKYPVKADGLIICYL